MNKYKQIKLPSNIEVHENAISEYQTERILNLIDFHFPGYERIKYNQITINECLPLIFSENQNEIEQGITLFSSLAQKFSFPLPQEFIDRLIFLCQIPNPEMDIHCAKIKYHCYLSLASLLGNSNLFEVINQTGITNFFFSHPTASFSIVAFSHYSLLGPSFRDEILNRGILIPILHELNTANLENSHLNLEDVSFLAYSLVKYPIQEAHFQIVVNLFQILISIQKKMQLDSELYLIRAVSQFVLISNQFSNLIFTPNCPFIPYLFTSPDPMNDNMYKTVLTFIICISQHKELISPIISLGAWQYIERCIKSPFEGTQNLALQLCNLILVDSIDEFLSTNILTILPKLFQMSYKTKMLALNVVSKLIIVSNTLNDLGKVCLFPNIIVLFLTNSPEYNSAQFTPYVNALVNLLQFLIKMNDKDSLRKLFKSNDLFLDWFERISSEVNDESNSIGDEEKAAWLSFHSIYSNLTEMI